MAVAVEQGDSIFVQSEPSGTYGPFTLLGGVYGLTLIMTGTGALNLQMKGPDLAGTAFNVGTGLAAAGQTLQAISLPAGSYQVVGSGTLNTCVVSPISQNRT